MATRDNGATKFETVRYEPKGAICHIILNRPEKLNAANDQLVEDVNDALFEFDADPELQVAILSGAGRAFCSGADVQQRQLRTREELQRLGGPAGRRSRENGLADTVNWKPVIAAVHGYALGLGYSLSQSCDLVVAAAGHEIPDPRGAARPRQRPALGRHLVLDGHPLRQRGRPDRPHVHRRGGPPARHGEPRGAGGRADPAAEALAAEILENPPLAVRANVRVMRWFVNEMQRQSALLHAGARPAPERRLPGVGPRLRREAQARLQGR